MPKNTIVNLAQWGSSTPGKLHRTVVSVNELRNIQILAEWPVIGVEPVGVDRCSSCEVVAQLPGHQPIYGMAVASLLLHQFPAARACSVTGYR